LAAQAAWLQQDIQLHRTTKEVPDMTYFDSEDAPCNKRSGAVALLIEPRAADLGEFAVRRALPSREQRIVGPFVFFDHMGPAEFPPGSGIAVRPHPHIGIATITYLFEGEIIHRDSLGVVQPIQPGAVNLMVAGRGIVHSERAGADLAELSHLHGIQSWIALPVAEQECDPAFTHYSAARLPTVTLEGAQVRIIMGSAYGQRSPVTTFSETLYLDCQLSAGAELSLPEHIEELACYVAVGEVVVDETAIKAGAMAVACPGKVVRLRAAADSRVMVIGGANIGPRQIYWNFVSDSAARIEQAKRDWRDGNFPHVPGETEFIPLPG
jgi:redox-sensitive bicupin YhaK (pirin superfamily)